MGYFSRNFVTKIAKQIILLLAFLGLASVVFAKLSGSLSPEAIAERLQPMGQVNVINATSPSSQPLAASSSQQSPKDIYEVNCKMCHQSGIAGAPKLGNKGDWAPRISQGLDTLVKTAISGIRAMPPKGNCLNCTPDEIRATVEYMVHAAQ